MSAARTGAIGPALYAALFAALLGGPLALACALRGGGGRGALIVLAGALVAARLAERFGAASAGMAAAATLWATPLYGVAVDGPSRAALAFAAGAIALFLCWPLAAIPATRIAGAVVAGLGALAIDPAAAGLLVLPLAATLPRKRPGTARRVRAAVVMTLLVLALLSRGAVVDALFASSGGLLFWSPALWAAMAGWLSLRKGDGHTAWAGAATAAAAVVAAALARVHDGGGVIGFGRDLAAVLPLATVGFAAVIDASALLLRRRPRLLVATGGALLVVWNLLLMDQYRAGRIPRDDTVAFSEVAENAVVRVTSLTGSPNAWPANWAFAARHHLPVERYDLLGGLDLFDPPASLGGAIDVGDLDHDRALLLGGWSVRHPCGPGACRDALSRAEIAIPHRRRGPLTLSLTAAGEGLLGVEVGGLPMGTCPLGPVPRECRLPLPAAAVSGGLVRLAFIVPPGARAEIDRLSFTPPGGPS